MLSATYEVYRKKNGQIINYSELARNFGISDMTARKYIDLLEGTFMFRLLQPWYTNIGKRQVKRPKLYFTDTGIFPSLLAVGRREELLTHLKLGASWEGFALECLIRSIGKRNEEVFFWSTHSGAEVDLFRQHQGKSWAVEFKYMDAPRNRCRCNRRWKTSGWHTCGWSTPDRENTALRIKSPSSHYRPSPIPGPIPSPEKGECSPPARRLSLSKDQPIGEGRRAAAHVRQKGGYLHRHEKLPGTRRRGIKAETPVRQHQHMG